MGERIGGAQRHPSGQPIRRRVVKASRSIYREPLREPLTPGLRWRAGASGIGFHVDVGDDDERGEFDAR